MRSWIPGRNGQVVAKPGARAVQDYGLALVCASGVGSSDSFLWSAQLSLFKHYSWHEPGQ